jgi:predicted dehydrogenase
MADMPIRIGIVGAGGIVKTRHLPGFAKIEDCQVVAVHNRRRANAEAVAKEWKIPHVVDSPEAVYGRDDVNAVVIGTTPYLHRDLTLAALKAGKHVFCQARMARTMAEARDMLAAAQAHPKQVTMLCPAPHVLPGQRYVERLLREGAIGDLRLVRLQHLSEALAGPNAPYHWRLDREISGYNVMTLGIYSEILNRWVGKAKTVSATGRLFTQQRKDPETGAPRTVTIPDSVAVSGELANGAHYQLMFSAVAPYSPGDFIEIYGSKGAIHYDVANQRVLLGKLDQPGAPSQKAVRVGQVVAKDTPTPVPIPAKERGEWQVEHDFVSAIRYGTPVFPNFQDGEAYMEFVEAVGRSLESGRTVTLPLP